MPVADRRRPGRTYGPVPDRRPGQTLDRSGRGGGGHAQSRRQAEAEREKRAKIIAAEGEALSAGKLAEAADVIAQHPIALQLRNLQVLGEIAVEKNSTIVFPAQFLDSVRALSQFVAAEHGHATAPAVSDAAAAVLVPGNAGGQHAGIGT